LEGGAGDALGYFRAAAGERTGGAFLVFDHENTAGLFGRETKGLPEPLLAANLDSLLTIPMKPQTRSLNLATAAGIVLFEAVRQQNVGGSSKL
jgi:tRNA(Leu) C34 or U34 (ribose-2'-O)-methylase TrmL